MNKEQLQISRKINELDREWQELKTFKLDSGNWDNDYYCQFSDKLRASLKELEGGIILNSKGQEEYQGLLFLLRKWNNKNL